MNTEILSLIAVHIHSPKESAEVSSDSFYSSILSRVYLNGEN